MGIQTLNQMAKMLDKRFARLLICSTMAMMATTAFPQEEKVEMLVCGDMEQWLVREIEESFIIGGKTKTLYEIAPYQLIKGDRPYTYNTKSPWGTSNVMAKVGVTKCSASVFPEKRGEGTCARLETLIEEVKVMGLVDITVLAAGSIFLGGVDEPIKNTKNPLGKLMMGVPFTKKPKALRFDYKATLAGGATRQKITGFGRRKTVEGADYPEVYMVLQKRWEDENGNIYAKRIATLSHRFTSSVNDWVNDFTLELEYGDISSRGNLNEFERLMVEEPYYTKNRKGKTVPIQEVGWGTADDEPTHVVLRFSSSHGGAYIGSPGNTLWIDNVRFVY